MQLILNKIKLLFTICFLAVSILKAQQITTIAGNGTGGYSGDGGQATAAKLYYPNGTQFDPAGILYITDTDNNVVRKVSASGIITTIAGIGIQGYSGDGGQATAAQLNYPRGILFDGLGNLYITEAFGNRVRKVNATGIISTFAGTGTAGFSGDGGQAIAAQLNIPYVSVFDAAGNMYIADYANNRIRKINTAGIISTFAGTGTGGYSGDGGQATAAELYTPVGLAFDLSSNLIISDGSNHRIRKINSSGIISTIAGNGTPGFSGDCGQAIAAQLNRPFGIAIDAVGNLYIGDSQNNRVRMVNTLGIITTIAGTGPGAYSGDGGPAIAAEIYWPSGLTIDGVNNLHIADQYNHRIRVINIANIGTITVNSATICTGSTATLTASGVSSYTWSTGATTASVVLSPTVTTTYTVAGSVGTCPSQTAVATITVSPCSTQLCSGNLGAPTYSNNFGSGAALYGPALPAGQTQYPYVTGSPPNGSYVISNTADPSGIVGYLPIGDHTGNPNGYMMVVNADYPPDTVYTATVTGLCPNTTYVFSSYVANNNTQAAAVTNCGGSYIYANVKLQVEYPPGTVQGSVSSGNLPTAPTSTALVWVEEGFVFTTVAGQTSAEITIINNAPGGCGNDYVVDDISLSPCGPGISLSIVPNQTVFCAGQAVTLEATYTSGSYPNPQYQWQFSNDGGTSWANIAGATSQTYSINAVTIAQGGMYQLIAAENGNVGSPSCSILAGPLEFTVNPPTSTLTISGSGIICTGQNITLTATGATTYSWNTGATTTSIVVNPTVTATYTVTGGVGTCSTQAVATVTVTPVPIVSITGNTIICAGASTTLMASGATTYTWNTGANAASVAFNPSNTTTYTVIGTSGTCTAQAIATVSVNPIPIVSITGNTVACAGNSTSLTASGANTYTWSTGANSATINFIPTSTASYTVTGGIGACINEQVITVNVLTNLTILISGDTIICVGQKDTLTASGAITYTWSTGAHTASIIITPTVATSYSVSAAIGTCFGTAFDSVHVKPTPVAVYTLNPNPATTLDPLVYFSNESINYTHWAWNFGDSSALDTIDVNPSHYYNTETGSSYHTSLTLSNKDGCINIDTVLLVIDPFFTFYIPNTFTPDGDGLNDVFKGEGMGISSFQLWVFDRWGENIFYSSDINKGWNGTLRGGNSTIVQEGVYVWKVNLEDALQTNHNYHGTVTIIK